MTKKKKVKTNKKSARTPSTIPTDYIHSIADRIHQMNPTKEILSNTMKDIYCTAHGRGYQRRIDDDKFFKAKREKRITAEWNKIKTKLDDILHSKTNQI